MTYYNHKTAVIIDHTPQIEIFEGQVIEYRIDVYKNILQSFETYCN